MWLLRGKLDKSASAIRTALDYSQRALAIAPSQVHFQFNIAFVQFALAQLTYSLSDAQRTLAEVQSASEGLEEGIETLTEISQGPNPPYPKHDLEQRANMGRNTMRRQLERALTSQREYEEKNATKLQEAREAREADIRRREELRRAAAETAAEEKRKIAGERHKMLELSRELAEKRADEEQKREAMEYTTDSETGERVKRKKVKKGGKRKKKGEESGTEGEGGEGEDRPRRKQRGKSTEGSGTGTEKEARAPKKRRKLARKGKQTIAPNSASGITKVLDLLPLVGGNTDFAFCSGGKETKLDKFKSSELVGDSDSDNAATAAPATNGAAAANTPVADEDTTMSDGLGLDSEEEDALVAAPTRKKPTRRIASDDDDEDEDVYEATASPYEHVSDGAEQLVPQIDKELDDAEEKAKGNPFADGEGAPKPMVEETVGVAGDPDTVIGGGDA